MDSIQTPPAFDPETLNREGWVLSTRRLVNYNHCNKMGHLYGGTLLSWLDEAASIFCTTMMDHEMAVTKAIDNMEFHTPTKLGEIVCIYSRARTVGRTSFTFDLLVVNQSYEGRRHRHIASTTMVWVALDEFGKPWEWNKKNVQGFLKVDGEKS